MKNSTVVEKKDSVKETKAVAKAVAKVIAKEVAAQKEEEKKMEEAKIVQTKNVETKKTETKKATPAKKAPAKKPATTKTTAAKKSTVAEEVILQYSNQEIMTSALVDKVKAAYVAEGHKADSIKKVRAYIKPEENMIYYVVNDEYASGISLF